MKKLFITYILLSGLSFVSAQNANPLDEKYKPASSSIFGRPAATSTNRSIQTDRKPNAITFVLTDFARSSIGFNYERKLNESFSTNAGIGIAIGRDLIETALNFYELKEEIGGTYESVSVSDLYGDSKYASGYNGSLGMKYFFNNDNSYNQHIGVRWRMASGNYTLPRNGDYSPSSLAFNVKTHIFSLAWGFSYCSGAGKAVFIHDMSYGFGAKLTYYDYYFETSKPADLQTEWNLTWKAKQENNKRMLLSPVFLFRYQLGISW